MGHLIFDNSQDLRYHVPATRYGKCVCIILFENFKIYKCFKYVKPRDITDDQKYIKTQDVLLGALIYVL